MSSNKTPSALKPILSLFLALALPALLSACSGDNLGVSGGGEQLSTQFSGIGGVTVLSPTSVNISWKPMQGYVKYNVFSSTQDAPIGEAIFDSFTVNALKPGTSYSFSVSGVKSSGA